MNALIKYLPLVAGTAIAAFGQGQFLFNNYVPSVGIDALFEYQYCGTYVPMAGTDWSFQVLGGPEGSAFAQLTELGPPTVIRADAPGYVVPLTLAVPSVPSGAVAEIGFRIAQRIGDQEVTAGFGGPWNVRLGDSTSTPPVPLGNQPIEFPIYDCPEPSPAALGAISLIVILCWARA